MHKINLMQILTNVLILRNNYVFYFFKCLLYIIKWDKHLFFNVIALELLHWKWHFYIKIWNSIASNCYHWKEDNEPQHSKKSRVTDNRAGINMFLFPCHFRYIQERYATHFWKGRPLFLQLFLDKITGDHGKVRMGQQSQTSLSLRVHSG